MLKLKGTGGEYIKKLLRILFSRYFLSAIFILCELALLFALIAYAGSYSLIFFVFLIVLDVFTVLSLINRDANPEYKVSWLVVVLILPVFGMVLYLLFYSRKISKSDAALIESIYERLDTDDTTAAHSTYGVEMDENFAALKESDAEAAGKVLALLSDDTLARLYRHTRVEYFALGEDMYKKMLCDIENAEHCIFLEYFIIKSGKMWDEIHSLLKAKAAGGVDVRLMYDDIGCMNSLPADFEKTLAAEGIKVLCFSPVSPRISTTHNNRDHRKILIVDGKCAYTGGINIADEYINEKERFGHWKDGGVRVTGMAVKGFVRLFLSGWGHALGKNEDYRKILSLPAPRDDADGGFYVPFGSGPAPIYKNPVGKNLLLNLINQAKKYVYITTPYLVIDYELTESIRGAARRGVDVRIITPSKADKKLVNLMTKSSYHGLLESGVRIYEYTPGFIHEKLLVTDDLYAVCGTINLDHRSLAHHFEDALLLYKSDTITEMHESFLSTVALCDERDKASSHLTLTERILRNLMRIFAPLM